MDQLSPLVERLCSRLSGPVLTVEGSSGLVFQPDCSLCRWAADYTWPSDSSCLLIRTSIRSRHFHERPPNPEVVRFSKPALDLHGVHARCVQQAETEQKRLGNNQRGCGTNRSYCYLLEAACFLTPPPPKVFYSSYAAAISDLYVFHKR